MHSLELKNISKSIKNQPVLKDISFKLESGEIVGFVGDNGSGKTMLFRAVCGLISPTQGEILFDSKPIGGQNRPSIGITIEHVSLFPDLTAFQNLKFLADINKRIGPKEIKSAISAVGLDPENPKPFKKFSLGMKQRLLLAQAIMENPDILLLDEPTNGIDKDGVQLFYNIAKESAEKGAIVMIASHYTSDITALCHRCYHVAQGGIQLEEK